jgi:hypothetical protein
MRFGRYEIDITKPPEGPPGTIIRESIFGDKETKESIRDKEDYKMYIQEFRRQMDKKYGGKK